MRNSLLPQTILILLALAGPAYAGCSGSYCADSSGNVFTISPPRADGSSSILGLNAQTGQHFTGTHFSNGVTIITPVPQGLPPLPLIEVQK